MCSILYAQLYYSGLFAYDKNTLLVNLLFILKNLVDLFTTSIYIQGRIYLQEWGSIGIHVFIKIELICFVFFLFYYKL